MQGFSRELVRFFQLNKRSIQRSGTSALGDLFTYTFPYYVVPTVFGLGAPVIILEATFRIFRGASVIYAAACDLAVPGQTRALAASDAPRLVRTTLVAAGLCCLPAAFACGLLVFAAQPLFAFLLRSAATVPTAVTPILIVLLLANLVWMVMQSLMQHTGFFREISRISASVAGGMVAATLVCIVLKFDIVGFLGAYAAVYTGGAIYYVIASIRGPIRAAACPLQSAVRGRLSQSETYRHSREPRQSRKPQRAEYCGGAKVLDHADVAVVLGRDMVGELLDRRIQEFDSKNHQEHADHGDIPGEIRCQKTAERHCQNENNGLLAHGRFAVDGVAEPAQRILRGAKQSASRRGEIVMPLLFERACCGSKDRSL